MSKDISNEFLNMKIRVEDEEHSKQIQEILFKLGYKWMSGNKHPRLLDKEYLFTYNGYIFFDDNSIEFTHNVNEEVTLEGLQSLLSVVEEKGVIKDISTITSDCNNGLYSNEYSLLQEVLNSLEVSMYLLDESNVNYSPKSFEMYLKGVINIARIIGKYKGGE